MYLILIYKYLGLVRFSKYFLAIVVLRLNPALLLFSVFKTNTLNTRNQECPRPSS